jgi:hypothetical protein
VPVANKDPDRFRRLTEEALNVTEHLRDSVMQAMEMSLTVDVGMKSTFSSKREDPFATESLMEPIPRALIDDPPTPVTVLSAIGCRVKKSDRSGEMWVVHALSRRKGDISKERSIRREDVETGAAVMAARSNSSMLLLLSRQSTEA